MKIPEKTPTEVFKDIIATSPERAVVLVVDDEEQNRMLLRDPLEARGFEVIEAENGFDALTKIEKRPPDVILLDAMMPKLDGFEVCRRIKSNEATAAIPVLMVTALSERQERLTGIQAGANDFLNKPVDLHDLCLRVSNAAYTKRLFDQVKIEKQKSERLLANILPKTVIERMKKGEINVADHHPAVTVILADLVGFTTLTSHISAEQIVCLLNEIFSSFDLLVEKHKMEKIKTIGDAYLSVAGISGARVDHAEASALCALEMLHEIQRFNSKYDTSIRIRIGIASGPAIAGVIGQTKFAYDLWGETVNNACHLESVAEPGSIRICETTFDLLRENFRFDQKQINNLKGSNVTSYRLLAID